MSESKDSRQSNLASAILILGIIALIWATWFFRYEPIANYSPDTGLNTLVYDRLTKCWYYHGISGDEYLFRSCYNDFDVSSTETE